MLLGVQAEVDADQLTVAALHKQDLVVEHDRIDVRGTHVRAGLEVGVLPGQDLTEGARAHIDLGDRGGRNQPGRWGQPVDPLGGAEADGLGNGRACSFHQAIKRFIEVRLRSPDPIATSEPQAPFMQCYR